MPTTQFDNPAERREASLFGMWAFLATEVAFFGPLFMGYVHGRVFQHEAFVSGSHHMHVWLGTINTAILLTSSLFMALSVRAQKEHNASLLRRFLFVTALLGLAFVCIKGYEYATEWSEALKAEGGEARFYFLYYAMTGVHALHLVIGIGIVSWLAWGAGRFAGERGNSVEVAGLYWHFVDIVWVFLYPMFYLLERYR